MVNFFQNKIFIKYMVYNYYTNKNLAKNDSIVLAKMKEGIASHYGIQAVRDLESKSNDSFNKVEKISDNDGKISLKEKVINFGKGIIRPIKTMFSSPKNIALTALSAVAAGGLIALTGGAAAPVMVAAGLLGGAFQIGKGIYRQIKAKTDDEARQAWQDMGSGTFTVGVSALGAKSALKAAKVANAKDMSFGSAILKCIKDLPANLVNGFKTASNKISSLFGIVKPPVVHEIKTLPQPLEDVVPQSVSTPKDNPVSSIVSSSTESQVSNSGNSAINSELKSMVDAYIKNKQLAYSDYLPQSIKEMMISKYQETITPTASNGIKALPPHVDSIPTVSFDSQPANGLATLKPDVIYLPEHIETFRYKPVKEEVPYGIDIIKSLIEQKLSNPKIIQSKPLELPPAQETVPVKIGFIQKIINFFQRFGLFLKD